MGTVPILQPACECKALCGKFSELFHTKEKAWMCRSSTMSLATAAILLLFEVLFGHPFWHLAGLCCCVFLNSHSIVKYDGALTPTTFFKYLEMFNVC